LFLFCSKTTYTIDDVCLRVTEPLREKGVRMFMPEYNCLIVSPANFWGQDKARLVNMFLLEQLYSITFNIFTVIDNDVKCKYFLIYNSMSDLLCRIIISVIVILIITVYYIILQMLLVNTCKLIFVKLLYYLKSCNIL